MIEVEIVVAGALGDLALSMLPGFEAERQLFTRLTVASQAEAGAGLALLERAGLEVTRVVEVSWPAAAADHRAGPGSRPAGQRGRPVAP